MQSTATECKSQRTSAMKSNAKARQNSAMQSHASQCNAMQAMQTIARTRQRNGIDFEYMLWSLDTTPKAQRPHEQKHNTATDLTDIETAELDRKGNIMCQQVMATHVDSTVHSSTPRFETFPCFSLGPAVPRCSFGGVFCIGVNRPLTLFTGGSLVLQVIG